jgi:DNA-directed RNA polymerase specialized sigma24 family protein
VEIGDVVRGSAETAATAFGAIRQLHGPTVHRFCLVVLGDSAAAEATASRVLALAAAAHPDERPGSATALPWLLSIACEVALDARRRSPRQRRVVGASEELDAAVAAAHRLPERELLAIALRGAAGLGYAEIGSLLRMSPEAARMACDWALRRIRDSAGRVG